MVQACARSSADQVEGEEGCCSARLNGGREGHFLTLLENHMRAYAMVAEDGGYTGKAAEERAMGCGRIYFGVDTRLGVDN